MILGEKKEMTLFIKINTFGVFFTIIIIVFICSIGIWGLNTQNYALLNHPESHLIPKTMNNGELIED